MTKTQGQTVGVAVAVVVLGTAAVVLFGLMGKSEQPRKPVVERVAPREPVEAGGNGQMPGVDATTPAAAGPAGVVVDGEERPVARAEVFLGRPNYMIDVGATGPNSNAGAIRQGRTDAEGRFSFPAGPAWTDIVVRSPDGYAHVRASAMPADGRIVLQAWGRIEGTLRVGKGPAANVSLTYMADGVMPGAVRQPPVSFIRPTTRGGLTSRPAAPPRPTVTEAGAYVRQTITARTDDEGRFVFEQIVPGTGRLLRGVTSGAGARIGRSYTLAQPEVAVGQTVTLALGGTGRPIVGKIVLEAVEEVPALEGQVLMRPPPEVLRGFMAEGRQPRFNFPLSAPLEMGSDGTFRAEDVPAGSHSLTIWADDAPVAGSVTERLAEGSLSFTVLPMEGGRSDEPLDVGTVTVKLKPVIKVGSAAPAVEVEKAGGGGTLKLADYQGKFVALMFIPAYEGQAYSPQRLAMVGALRDRAGAEELAMLAIVLPNGPQLPPNGVPAVAGWEVGVAPADWQRKLDPRYATTPGNYLIDREGVVLAKLSPYGGGMSGPYGLLDRALGVMGHHSETVVVDIERVVTDATVRQFDLREVPGIMEDDAGKDAVFSIVDGPKANFGAGPGIFNDGGWPKHDKDETGMLTFMPQSVTGRIKADLGKVIEVERISSYAWYKDAHRWAQVYRVYGSDGTAAGFNADPKIGVDPARCGWTLIATVDTRQRPGGQELRDDDRGQTGVNVHAKAGGAMGKHRYLLFVTFATETKNMWGQTFWSEIDVVGR